MASIATAATRAEINTLYGAVVKLEIALRQIVQGDGSPELPGRFTAVQCDALIDAVGNAITAATT